MRKIFTYKLGAGASFHTLPLVSDFSRRLEEYIGKMKEFEYEGDTFPKHLWVSGPVSEVRNDYLSDLSNLVKILEESYSVDTYARKLYLTRSDYQYKLLKLLISEFLVYEELSKGVDYRYEAFFATIIELSENGIKLPDNIRILSWNYDKQIEFCVGQFIQSNNSSDVEELLQLYPRNESSDLKDGFSFFKVNGTIGGFVDLDGFKAMAFDLSHIKDGLTEEMRKNLIISTLYRYDILRRNRQYYFGDSKNEYTSFINYSWEKSDTVKSVRDGALLATKETNILVVIGYSFPTFNRKLDSLILRNMQKLEKIYIQSPSDTISGVVQRVKALLKKDVPVIPIDNVDEFYIPFEFN